MLNSWHIYPLLFCLLVGERVSVDIRLAVFNHPVHLHPGFFETNAPSEIQSRVTTDTTLLQTVIGSSVSIALRNIPAFLNSGMVPLVSPTPSCRDRVGQRVICGHARCFLWSPCALVSCQSRSTGRRRSHGARAKISKSFRLSIINGRILRSLAALWTLSWTPPCSGFGRAVLVAVVMLLVLRCGYAVRVGGQDVLSGRTSPET